MTYVLSENRVWIGMHDGTLGHSFFRNICKEMLNALCWSCNTAVPQARIWQCWGLAAAYTAGRIRDGFCANCPGGFVKRR